MLTIRKEQVLALDGAQSGRDEARLLEHLRTTWSEWTRHQSEDALREDIRRGVARARAHGFSDLHDLACFLELQCLFSPGFGTGVNHVWARLLLEHPTMPVWLKRERLMEEARQRAPAEAPLGRFPGRREAQRLGAREPHAL